MPLIKLPPRSTERIRRRSWWYLVSGILALSALVSLIIFFAPSAHFAVYAITITILPIFFLLLFFCLFSLGTFIFKSKLHGLFLALFAVIYLLFRQNDLTHPFFAILLAVLFFVLELMFTYRK